jgi:hypothetical protein
MYLIIEHKFFTIFLFKKIKEHEKIVKNHKDLEKILFSYVYIIENYSKTNKLNINSKIIPNDEESSLYGASNLSEIKSFNQSTESLDLIKLHT